MIARVLVAGCGAAFAAFGLAFLACPDRLAPLMDLGLGSSTARSDLRAVVGGLELGLGGFLGWCAADPGRVRMGAVAAGCGFVGMAGGRLVGILVDREASPLTAILLLAELVGLACAALAVRSAPR